MREAGGEGASLSRTESDADGDTGGQASEIPVVDAVELVLTVLSGWVERVEIDVRGVA